MSEVPLYRPTSPPGRGFCERVNPYGCDSSSGSRGQQGQLKQGHIQRQTSRQMACRFRLSARIRPGVVPPGFLC